MSYALQLPLAAKAEGFDEMATKQATSRPMVELPPWVLKAAISLAVLLLSNLGISIWWASELTANQQHMLRQLETVESKVVKLTDENIRLREEMAGLKALQSRPSRER